MVVTRELRDLQPRRWLQATPAGGPGRITISAAQRPLRHRCEVALHFQLTGNGEPTGTVLRTFKPRVNDGTADRAVFKKSPIVLDIDGR